MLLMVWQWGLPFSYVLSQTKSDHQSFLFTCSFPTMTFVFAAPSRCYMTFKLERPQKSKYKIYIFVCAVNANHNLHCIQYSSQTRYPVDCIQHSSQNTVHSMLYTAQLTNTVHSQDHKHCTQYSSENAVYSTAHKHYTQYTVHSQAHRTLYTVHHTAHIIRVQTATNCTRNTWCDVRQQLFLKSCSNPVDQNFLFPVQSAEKYVTGCQV